MDGSLRILFVDDEPNDVTLARADLERDGIGFTWRSAASEQQLRDELTQFVPDIVLCDYTIPGYSGWAALELVMQLCPRTPFLFVSGTIGEDTAIQCLSRGAADYILKGSLRRLGPAVRRALGDARDRLRMQHMEQSQQQLIALLGASTDLVLLSNTGGCITFANDSACRVIGKSREQLVGAELASLYTTRVRARMRRAVMVAVSRTGSWKGSVAIASHSGGTIPTEQVITAHRNDYGDIQFFSTVARDLRADRTFESRIHHLAHFDTLTGLPNLTHMRDVVRRAIACARRKQGIVALVLINVDGFRLVAEGFGRALAGKVLKDIAATLKSGVGQRDTVAHIGTDEFLVLMSQVSGPDAIVAHVHRLLDSIAAPRKLSGETFQLSATAGIAICPDHGDDFETLLRDARAATYQSKERCLGGIQVHARDAEHCARERLLLRTGLRNAIQRGELALHYQPQFEIVSGRACGVEALARWFRADGSVTPPSIFIPLAEQAGLVDSLGAWVLQEACTTVGKWGATVETLPTLCVNVSTYQLRGDFPSIVARVLEKTGFPASKLELEITESVLLDDVDMAIRQLAELKRFGTRIAIDDFGTGYSSLSYLSQLPVDRLKVDRSLITRMAPDSKNLAIMRAVISLGRECGFSVLAEGVETEEQFATLNELGCHQAQGYLLAPPTGAQPARALLQNRWGARPSPSRRIEPLNGDRRDA